MSVVAEISEGWILSHRDSLTSRFKLKRELFNVCTPFIMDSAAIKIAKELGCQGVSSKKRKRSQRDSKVQDDVLGNLILQGFARLLQIGINLKYFDDKPESESDWLDNNRTAREAVKKLDTCSYNLLDVSEKYSQASKLEHVVLNSDSKSLQLPSLTLVKSESSTPVVVSLENEKYVIPEKSSFILGDVAEAVKNLATMGTHFSQQ